MEAQHERRGRIARGWTRLDAFLRARIPDGVEDSQARIHYAALLAVPLHLLSTAPYALLFALFGAWQLAALVVPLCLSYVAAWFLLRRGWRDAGIFLILGAVSVSITVFSCLLGKDSRLEVTLFYCTVAPFLFFSPGSLGRIALANLIPALCWGFLELKGYALVRPYELTQLQLRLFRFLIMPTAALLQLVPLFFLLRGLGRTEERLRDALVESRRSGQAKSEFLTLVSHELRTPLNGLLGTLDLLNGEELKPRLRHELEVARASSLLLHRIIGDILDFSRGERGMATLVPVPVQVGPLLKGALVPFGIQAQGKGLKLAFLAEEGAPRLVLDPQRLQQICCNLVSNAVKFTGRGSIEVRMSWRPVDAERGTLHLDVADTGIGIPPQSRDEAFLPFSQLHRQTHANAEGCGLGLAIVRQLVELMGGTVRIGDGPQGGTLVGVRIPATIAGPEATPASVARPGGRPFRGRALVVDDVLVNRTVATRVMAGMGFECDVAVDGREAVEAWARDGQELILMDLQMPVMDGVEAAVEILRRARDEERDPPLIVALTANTFDEHRERCRKAGMDGFLGKPLSRAELMETLRPLLERRLPHMLEPESLD